MAIPLPTRSDAKVCIAVILTEASATIGLTGAFMQMNAANNKSGGNNRGKTADASKNERQ